jgi:ERF superfamily
MSETITMNWSMSPSIGNLVKALALAQINFEKVLKDIENPAYVRGNKAMKYADLATVIDATRPHLAANGLSIIQMPHARFGTDDAKELTLTTLLAHSSGEWIASDLTLPAMMRERFDAQSVGSAITYARRYALAAITGVAQEDDDGNKAAGIGTKEAAKAVASSKLRKHAEEKGNSAIALTEWKEGFVAVSGDNGLAILKSEVEPEELKTVGFHRDDNVLVIPAGNAFALEDMCKRANVPVHWSES